MMHIFINIFLIIVFITLFFILFTVYEGWSKKRKIEKVFSGRMKLDAKSFYEKYFKSLHIPEDIVMDVKEILEKYLDADLSRISDEDDFSKNLSFFWKFDSMADVEIILEIENKFNIKIENNEALNTTKLKDLVILVWKKIQDKNDKNSNE
ncbi:acyl carrier protein [Leptospira bouyouniensis]|uniref:Acyl carrier protein n=1 Tax=Leptospira bouyouniensis TaxID=2484911 RepID=A0ABY2L6C5_9LEPT|nr:acyl carrier protein [Leptospira bouyouniensis]TGK51345.1 acyl carrier protein [Leptospira bouyouniensis]